MSFVAEIRSLLSNWNIDYDELANEDCVIIQMKSSRLLLRTLKEIQSNAPLPSDCTIIDEDHFLRNKSVVRSRISSLVGKRKRIHGRETKVKRITKIEAFDFLIGNHLNIPVKVKHNYGLFHKENLVAVACFSQVINMNYSEPNFTSSELIRYCNLNDYSVVGGLSKLIQHFVKTHNVEHLMTYADKDWSTGKSYLSIGFEQTGELESQTFYIDTKTYLRHPVNKIPLDLNKENLIKVVNSGSLKFEKRFL